MGNGYGYGKTILYGEHFVVYNLPAIACGYDAKTTCTAKAVKGQKDWSCDDQRPETPGYKKEKFDEGQKALQLVLNHLKIDTTKQKIEMTFAGDLVAASGVGASAAQCVALARALNEEFKLGLNDDKINQAAYEGEKGYHGTPSGIDNTAATYGGLIWFVKGTPNTVELIKVPKKMYIVIGNTGVTSSTTTVVGDVKKLKEENPLEFTKIFESYTKIVQNGKQALIKGDLKTIGMLMNRNHSLLQDITVSSEVNDVLVDIARDNGALGAKLSGTGRGGLIIALAENAKSQEKIATAIEQKGYMAWRTTMG